MNFVRGHFIHRLIEARFNGEDTQAVYKKEVERVRKEVVPKLEEKTEEIEKFLFTIGVVLEEYMKVPPAITEAVTEKYVEYQINRTTIFEGQVDAYGLTQNSNLAVYEAKSKAKPGFDPVAERFRPQALLYAAALIELGIKVTHILREFIYTPTMSLPEMTKRGYMSRANITCTWDRYKAELIRHNLDPRDYEEDMKRKLAFEVRELLATKINTSMMLTFKEDIAYEAKHILTEKTFPRTWNYECVRCPFKDPCFMGLMDPKGERDILDRNYKTRKSHYDKDAQDND